MTQAIHGSAIAHVAVMPTSPESRPLTTRTMSYIPSVVTDRMMAVMHAEDADMLVLTATRETRRLLLVREMTLPQLKPYLERCVCVLMCVCVIWLC